MSTWLYTAATHDGKLTRGAVEADSADAAQALLLREGLWCSSVISRPGTGRGPRKAPLRDMVLLFRGLATLLAAGLPVDRALDAVKELVPARLHVLLAEARRKLQEGATLANALTSDAGAIPAGVVAVLAAGERAGRLGEALENLASALERELALRSRINNALAYPAVLGTVGAVSLGVIVVIVIPRFATMLADAGRALPPLTAGLLATSAWLARWWTVVLMAGAMMVAMMHAWSATPHGRRLMHGLLLQAPGIGGIRWRVSSARSLGALHAAIETGMPLIPALMLAREATQDVVLQERWSKASARVLEGGGLGRALAAEGVLPPVAQQLMGLGEATGQLGPMALRAGTLLREESDQRLEAAVRLLEPGLIILFGGLVGVVAAALLQAVYGLRPAA